MFYQTLCRYVIQLFLDEKNINNYKTRNAVQTACTYTPQIPEEKMSNSLAE